MIDGNGNQLIFLCGLPRSGTTLLSTLLGNHPEVFAPPEPWLLLRLEGLYGEACDTKPYDDHIAALAVKSLFSDEDFMESSRAFALTAYNRLLSRSGARILVDKTPRYYHILPWISRLFPQARMIWLQRNPLDVAASYKTTWHRDPTFLTGEALDSTSFDFIRGIPSLCSFFDTAPGHKLEIRYEDLVERPQQELERLCLFCGIDYRGDMNQLDFRGQSLKSYESSHLGDKKIFQTRSVHSTSVDSWQEHLTPEETKKLCALIGREPFSRMGYADFVSTHAELFEPELSEHHRQLACQHLLDRYSTLKVRLMPRIYELEHHLREAREQVKAFEADRHALERDAQTRIEGLELEREDLRQRSATRIESLEHEREDFLQRSTTHIQTLETKLQGLQKNSQELIATLQAQLMDQQRTSQARVEALEAELHRVSNERDEQKLLAQTQDQELRTIHKSMVFKISRLLFPQVRGLHAMNHRTIPSSSPGAPAPAAASPLPSSTVDARLNLGDQLDIGYGQHRSGWKYGLSFLRELHHPEGVTFDAFIERTFCWHPAGIHPHTKPWIGVIHVPPDIPAWFLGDQANEAVFATPAWQASLPHCRGLFALSEYHRQALQSVLPIPVGRLYFPSETPVCQWSWEAFSRNPVKRIVQVGWWLRHLHAIHQLPETPYRKTLLDCNHPVLPTLLEREQRMLEESGSWPARMPGTVETLRFLPDDEYDRLLSENIVFLHLYGASANNAVIECILRNTPLLVNPLPAVREYLGEEYPLYFDTLEEAAAKAADLDLIHQTHIYLRDLAIKPRLTGQHFLESLASSDIYRSLPQP